MVQMPCPHALGGAAEVVNKLDIKLKTLNAVFVSVYELPPSSPIYPLHPN
jgi:hypothetical protein